ALSVQAQETEKKLAAEQARLEKFAAQYAPLKKSTFLEQEIGRLEAQVKARQEIVETLKSGALGSTNGYSRYMRAFARQSVSGLWLTSFDILGDGNEMAIGGRTLRAELVPVYVQRLSREQVMKGRQFAFLQISQPQAEGKKPASLPYLEFSLQSSEQSRPAGSVKPANLTTLPLSARGQELK
ncbi:MAG TPA: hypothetical protein VLL03_03485, partial [Burkholderiales bacterium]|nr:hypothetical protein [Burkholderiales bacterium]